MLRPGFPKSDFYFLSYQKDNREPSDDVTDESETEL